MSQKEKRPNILFAIADDASHMGAYGHDFVNTPNFDRVAKEGILFENAFTSNPKCAPSRASLLTGKNTWQLEEAGIYNGIFPDKFDVYGVSYIGIYSNDMRVALEGIYDAGDHYYKDGPEGHYQREFTVAFEFTGK